MFVQQQEGGTFNCMSERWVVKSRDQAKAFCAFVNKAQEDGKVYTYEMYKLTRSGKQNAALHSMMRRLATRLNDSGREYSHPWNEEFKIEWTEVMVKEVLFRPVIRAMFDCDSTTELTTEELSHAVTATLDRVAQVTGVVEGFTLEESQLLRGE